LRANRNYAVFSLVRAFDLELGLPLSQAPINDKSNEIPASKEVLQRIDVQGKIVSLDAMGAQRAIARKIIEGGGDYVLALKGNQPALHEDVSIYLNDIAKPPYQDVTSSTWETLDKDHGRIEKRQCLAVKVPKWLSQRMRWRGLKSLIRLESQVYRGSTKSTSIRYYISSLELHACEFMRIIRDHWRIEMIHWHLDNNLLEDRSTIHGRFSSQNFSSLRAFALYALRASAPNCSIKILCQRAMRQPDLILKVLDLQRN
jgi:predicted transposase YbfD/YdcC